MVQAKKIITLSLCNRPAYTEQVLQHLTKCVGVSEYRIIPVIDVHPNDHFRMNADHLTRLLLRYTERLSIDVPRYHDQHVGCNANIFTCLNVGFQFTDYVIHLEDDIILAKDALAYFEWAYTAYREDKTVFTVDAYNNTAYAEMPNAKEVERAKSFKPWAVGWFYDRFEAVRQDWQFEYGPRTYNGKKFEGGGWDVFTKQCLRGDRYRIYPLLPRAKNIGAKGGCHTPSQDWHNKKHIDPVKYWSNDLTDPVRDFYERKENGTTA
jgi:hypothetical protein